MIFYLSEGDLAVNSYVNSYACTVLKIYVLGVGGGGLLSTHQGMKDQVKSADHEAFVDKLSTNRQNRLRFVYPCCHPFQNT